jgi:serine protease Do
MSNIEHSATTRRLRSALMAGTAALAVVGIAAGGGLLTPNGAVAENVSAKVQPVQTFDFADLVEAVSPAVVSVLVEGKGVDMVTNNMPGMPDFKDLPEDSPLRKFFKDFEDQFGQQGRGGDGKQHRGPRQMGQGSGFIISEDGYVVTNNHVAGDAEKITVTMSDGKEYDAKLIGADDKTDLALLKIDGKDLPYVEFADKPARIGQWVVAVGNPFGLGGTVTAGIVSAEGRDIGSGPYDNYIQIDAPVNRGNSGGPTFNTQGKVIGVNTAIFSPSGGNVGIAFDIPASMAVPIIEQLKEHGSISRGWLGVQIQPVNEDISESLGLDKPEGAIVASTLGNSPAGEAGVKSGDVILSVNGKSVKDARDLARQIGNLSPKEKAKLEVWRDGERKEITVKLGKQPSNKEQLAMASPDETTPSGEVKNEALGLTVAPAGEDQSGVVIADVDPDGEAARKGLEAGDLIVEAGGSQVSSPEDLTKAVEKAEQNGRKAVLLRIKKGDNERFVALPLRKA